MTDLLPPGIPQLKYEDLKDELVSFLHGEKTAYSRDVIQYYIEHDKRLSKAYNELQGLTKLLQHTPEIEPSKNFHRRIAKALPELRYTHKVSTNLQTLITEAGWGLEERVLFLWAYLKFRLKQQPSAILSLCGMILFLLTAITILPKVINSTSYNMHNLAVHDIVIPDVIKPEKSTFSTAKKASETPATVVYPDMPDLVYKSEHEFKTNNFGDSRYPTKAIEKPLIEKVIQKLPSETRIILNQPKLQVLNWFSKRNTKDKTQTKREREAINDALSWLATMQHSDGSFQINAPEKTSEKSELTESSTDSEIEADNTTIILTAYAALSFITDGYSSFAQIPAKPASMTKKEYAEYRKQFAEFRIVTRNAINYLKSVQDEDGFIGTFGENSMLAHSMALLAMVEDRITSNNWRLIAAIRKAVINLADYQNYDGGWGHRPKDNLSLMSITSWCVLALRTASESDSDLLADYPDIFKNVQSYISKSGDEEGFYAESDSKSYPEGYLRPTSEGLFLRSMFNMENPTQNKSVELLTNAENGIPRWEFSSRASNGTYIDYDYWFFGYLALNSKISKLDKNHVKLVESWNNSLNKVLLDNQYEYGAWDEVVPHAGWGKVYSTAMAVLTLQNKYRYTFD